MAGGWRNSWDPPESEPVSEYIQAWEEELPEHPVIAELRAQPGRWAIVSGDVYVAVKQLRHPNIQSKSPLSGAAGFMLLWLPDPVVAAMQVLRGRDDV